MSETPELIQQLLWWKGIESGLMFLMWLMTVVVIIAGNVIQYKLTKKYWDKATDNWGDLRGEYAFNCAQVLFVFPLIEFWSIDWLQILVAPKLYLIEYAASLVG